MLVAKLAIGDRICSLDHDRPVLRQFGLDGLFCPNCSNPVVVVAGDMRLWHFRHVGRECESMDPAKRGGESVEHQRLKAAVARNLRTRHPNAVVTLEHRFENISRIADICVTHENGVFEVHEIQLSEQTFELYRGRSNDYYEAGAVEVYWYLPHERLSRNDRLGERIFDHCGTVMSLTERRAPRYAVVGVDLDVQQ